MTAAMLVLEPIFEADLPPELYAYRPGETPAGVARLTAHRGHRGTSKFGVIIDKCLF